MINILNFRHFRPLGTLGICHSGIAIDGTLIINDALGYFLDGFLNHNFVMVGEGDDRIRRCLQGLNFFDIDHHNGII